MYYNMPSRVCIRRMCLFAVLKVHCATLLCFLLPKKFPSCVFDFHFSAHLVQRTVPLDAS